jgi:membrane protein DedA with SNARE-associated domain
MTAALQQFLDWINAHPNWALALLLITSVLDAIFIVGAFVPAAVVLFAVGALVALGSLDLWTVLVVAALGAVIGDGLSFWLGRRYGEALFASKLMRRYPEAVANSRRFFDRNGVQGVMLARFLGPLRALTPALAGASGMRTWVFVTSDSIAALGWALAYVLPGVVFGASLGLAAEVAGRLATLLLALIVVLWVAIWLAGLIGRRVQAHTEDWVGTVLDWSRRHRRLGKFGAVLTDSSQPETPALALLAVVLLVFSALWLYLFASPALHPFPSAVDAAIFQTLRDLHVPWGLTLAQTALQLGEWQVYGPVALATFAVLALLRKRRAAAHWLAALAFGALLSLGLHAVPTLAPPYQFFGTPTPQGYSGRDLVLAAVIYAFLPVLLATGRAPALRRLFYGAALTVLLLIVLAQLYLGAQWYSLALYSMVVAVVWAALLGLGYRRHRPEDLPARRVSIPILLVFAVAVCVQLSRKPLDAPPPAPGYVVVEESDWRHQVWKQLPAQRQDVAGRPKQPFQLQWAGSLAEIETELRAAGWQDLAPLTAGHMLRWLSSDVPLVDLPILPQVHGGEHPALTLRLPLDDERQYLLRLWPSGFRLEDGRPIWIANVNQQRARGIYRVLRYPVAESARPPLEPVLDALPTVQRQARGSVWLLSSVD